MPTEQVVTVEGLEELARGNEERARRLRNALPAFRKIDKHISSVFTRQFATEGAFGGRRWAPLKRARRKRPGGNRGGILRHTNELWASLVKGGSAPKGLRLIGPQELTRGTTVSYARFHQEGTVHLPVRQPVPDPMPEHVQGVWIKILEDYVMTGKV